MGRKMKGRHDSAGPCEACGWDTDKFAQCTNPECESHDEDEEDE